MCATSRVKSNTKMYVLVSFLFICGANGYVYRTPDVVENAVDRMNDAAAGAENFDGKLFVFDDNDNPVQINLELDFPETEDQTRRDIQNRVNFYLYTRSNPKKPDTLYVNDVAKLKKSHFKPERPTKFITHGWINSHKSKACYLIRDAFLQHGDYNVIVVNWSKISQKPYLWASRRVLMVGQYVSSMINFLAQQGMDVSQVSLVGHSLGAHIVGLAARNAKGNVKFVVGLDPALPNFLQSGPGSRISRDDAQHVEIIHTNAGLLGFSNSIGQIDFYPNGGTFQVGCTIDLIGACSHLRAVRLYAESINSDKGFWGVRCKSYSDYLRGDCESQPTVLMGGVEPKTQAKGEYYLQTGKKAPFAQGR
ncbi:phospholipase A1-like [Ptiloglossa arizonensis]|uniref:phospholipase A1-like n=1 Tax=Ptiloglossa arizonensis TaxID=3350558 RepID=UPI003FA069C3